MLEKSASRFILCWSPQSFSLNLIQRPYDYHVLSQFIFTSRITLHTGIETPPSQRDRHHSLRIGSYDNHAMGNETMRHGPWGRAMGKHKKRQYSDCKLKIEIETSKRQIYENCTKQLWNFNTLAPPFSWGCAVSCLRNRYRPQTTVCTRAGKIKKMRQNVGCKPVHVQGELLDRLWRIFK